MVAVAGLTVLIGLSGQISIGNGAFMAIGGYTTALLLMHLGWPLARCSLASAAVAAVVGLSSAWPRPGCAAPTWPAPRSCWPWPCPRWPTSSTGVFGGDQGLSVAITPPAFLGATFPPTRWQAWVTCAAALIALVLLANLIRSRVGRSWRAVRDDEVAASLAGLNVARLRVLAFVVSAACAGLGGGLLAVVTGIVAPGAYTLTLSIALLTAAVVGGLGTLPGALWGSLVLVLVPTYVTDVATSHGLSSAAARNIPIAAYGVILIVVMLLFPDGIQGGIRRLFGSAATAPRRRDADASDSTAPRRRIRRLHRPAPAARASEHQEEGTT